ncbi:MAG: hypothetical protein ABI459_05285 [Deltaproteobacteria bacterium]
MAQQNDSAIVTVLRHPVATLVAAGLVAALFALSSLLPPNPEVADRIACRETPEAECLARIGLRLFDNQPTRAPSPSTAERLAGLGLYDEAVVVDTRFYALSSVKYPPDAARNAALRNVSHFKIIEAIMSGKSVKQAYEAHPEADAGALWLVGLKLLGEEVDQSGTRAPVIDAEMQIDTIRDLIGQIRQVTTAPYQLAYAAELSARIGDADLATDILRDMRPQDRTYLNFSPELMSVVGPEFALRVWLAVSGKTFTPASAYRVAAEAAASLPEAENYLRAAFAAAQDKSPWPDFGDMQRIVGVAADRGLDDLARELAREMGEAAKTTDSPFIVFHQIDVAGALRVVGAPNDEVRMWLNKAEASFPGHRNEVIAFGVVSGPIAWPGSGLEREARVSLALIWLRLGDVEHARMLLADIDQPVISFNDILSTDLPLDQLSTVQGWARASVSSDEFAYLQIQMATWMLRTSKDVSKINRARDILSAALAAPLPTGEHAEARVFSTLNGSELLGNQTAVVAALSRVSDFALNSRNPDVLIRAAAAHARVKSED